MTGPRRGRISPRAVGYTPAAYQEACHDDDPRRHIHDDG
jgi:hypothetical protein